VSITQLPVPEHNVYCPKLQVQEQILMHAVYVVMKITDWWKRDVMELNTGLWNHHTIKLC